MVVGGAQIPRSMEWCSVFCWMLIDWRFFPSVLCLCTAAMEVAARNLERGWQPKMENASAGGSDALPSTALDLIPERLEFVLQKFPGDISSGYSTATAVSPLHPPGYGFSVLSHNMEIIKFASWSVQHDAQTELDSMTLMQFAPAAMHIFEQDVPLMIISTWFFSHDDNHGDDVVPVVRVDPSVVDDNTPAAVPQIQRRGLLRLSSVKDIQYLQLSPPLPQVQTPDRPSGEPPAGHQLVWSIEALEDCICGTFGSELSTDGRSPCGSFCSLRCRHDVLSSSLFGLCFSVWLYLTLFSGAVMYYDR